MAGPALIADERSVGIVAFIADSRARAFALGRAAGPSSRSSNGTARALSRRCLAGFARM
jgi:hypothetical protein